MTFAGSMVQLAAVAHVLARAAPSDALDHARAAAREAAAAAESLLDDADELADPLADAVDGQGVVAVLGRGPGEYTRASKVTTRE